MPLSALYLVSFAQETKAKWVDGERETSVLEGINSWKHPHALATDYYEVLHSHEWYAPFSPLTMDAWKDIPRSLLEQHHSPEKELMGNAKHHFSTHEYRTATVEAVTALELGSSAFVRERYKCKALSCSRSTRADRGLGVAACLNKHLPSVLGEQELDTWLNVQRCEGRHLRAPFRRLGDDLAAGVILSRCINLNTLRNKIVHEGTVPDEKDIEEIQEGIEAAEWLLSFTQESN